MCSATSYAASTAGSTACSQASHAASSWGLAGRGMASRRSRPCRQRGYHHAASLVLKGLVLGAHVPSDCAVGKRPSEHAARGTDVQTAHTPGPHPYLPQRVPLGGVSHNHTLVRPAEQAVHMAQLAPAAATTQRLHAHANLQHRWAAESHGRPFCHTHNRAWPAGGVLVTASHRGQDQLNISARTYQPRPPPPPPHTQQTLRTLVPPPTHPAHLLQLWWQAQHQLHQQGGQGLAGMLNHFTQGINACTTVRVLWHVPHCSPPWATPPLAACWMPVFSQPLASLHAPHPRAPQVYYTPSPATTAQHVGTAGPTRPTYRLPAAALGPAAARPPRA